MEISWNVKTSCNFVSFWSFKTRCSFQSDSLRFTTFEPKGTMASTAKNWLQRRFIWDYRGASQCSVYHKSLPPNIKHPDVGHLYTCLGSYKRGFSYQDNILGESDSFCFYNMIGCWVVSSDVVHVWSLDHVCNAWDPRLPKPCPIEDSHSTSLVKDMFDVQ